MENPIIATGLAFAVTLLTSLFKSATFTDRNKSAIALVLSLVAGTAAVILDGADVTLGSLSATAIAVFGASQIAYNFILKGTKLDQKLVDTRLFGSSTEDVEAVVEVVAAAEKVAKPKKAVKKSAPSPKVRANSKRVQKD